VSEAPPELIFIAGPNGAGKTTFATKFVPVFAPAHLYLNVDEATRMLGPDASPVDGARRHIGLLRSAMESHQNVIVETTLAGLGYLKTLVRAKVFGYSTLLHYIQLSGVEESISRVKKRVSEGGHGVPEADIRRRFSRSRENFRHRYKPLVDMWWLYESRNGKFVIVDAKEN